MGEAVTVSALVDFAVQWQWLSLLTMMARALWPCRLGGEKPGGLPGGSDVLAET